MKTEFTIYHGSPVEVRVPLLEKCKENNDYGKGFYCTADTDMAKEWASAADRDGYSNKYRLDMDGLNILDLNDGSFTILHWLSILLENRKFHENSPLAKEAKTYLLSNFRPDYEKYDIIKGYRADDSYFSFAQDFINGTISLRQLSFAMKLGNLGDQIVLKSQRAFEDIRFIEAEAVDSKIWYIKKEQRDTKARKEYFQMDRDRYIKGEIYITRILDEEIKADDPRIR